ncbi:MAG: hypothetical protein HY560_11575 [Gemmatimonadetes bacterium]|nr:hypothetical protein [Gemmatimonadota bacterium]
MTLGLFLFGSLSLHSQQAGPKPDSLERRRYHDALSGLRDTLDAVTAAAFEINRDLRAAGGETVLARAERLRDRCRAAAPALADAGTTFQRAGSRATALIRALRRLRDVLRQQCEIGFRAEGSGSWADSLRAWAPFRTSEIGNAIREYEGAAGRFAAAVGVKLEPKLPTAGPSTKREEGKGKREE